METPSISSKQMARVDEEVPEKYGITESRMMENAAYQIAGFIRQNYAENRSITVYAGKGNNGGDALAAARRLANWGRTVYIVVATKELDGIRKEELEILEKMGKKIYTPDERMPDPDVALDGLIGYSLKGDPRPPFDRLIGMVNDAHDVVSIDVPSGLDADTGEKLEPYVDADQVVTLGLPKTGLEHLDAEIWLADISIPDEVYGRFDLEVEGLFADKSLKRVK